MVVYPVPGRRVRCPVTSRPVPDEGLTVPDGDLFWARRLRDGDVSQKSGPADHSSAPQAWAMPARAEASDEEVA